MSSKHIINIQFIGRDQGPDIAYRRRGNGHSPFHPKCLSYHRRRNHCRFWQDGRSLMHQIHNAGQNDIVDAKGSIVLPCWCDSHTHLVFAGSREDEFVDKIRGQTYAEINAAGGGILNSSKKLNDATEDQLFTKPGNALEEMSRLGTGAIEIKSGYGLTVEGELKMLRVIRKLKEKSKLTIKVNFSGRTYLPRSLP